MGTIMEATHTTPAERVWEMVIHDPAVSWLVYRGERLPSLYPYFPGRSKVS